MIPFVVDALVGPLVKLTEDIKRSRGSKQHVPFGTATYFG